MSPTDPSEDGREGERRDRRGLVVLLVVLVLLLLLSCCAWALLWPVPPEALEQGWRRSQADRRVGFGLSDVASEETTDSRAGTKGIVLAVSFTLTARREMPFDATCVRLEVDDFPLPPLSPDPSGDGQVRPTRLEAGLSQRLRLLFAVPRGSHDATLVVQPAHVHSEAAPRARLPRLEASGR